jgi:hypothetical protein
MPGALDRLARACHPPGAHWFPEAANSCFPARAIESAKRLRSAQLPAPEPMVTLVVRLNRRADAAPMHTLSDVGRPCARARRARRSLGRAWTSCHLTAPPVSSYWWRSSESRAPDMCSYKTGQGAAQGSRRRRRSTACQDRGRCCTPMPPCPSAARDEACKDSKGSCVLASTVEAVHRSHPHAHSQHLNIHNV